MNRRSTPIKTSAFSITNFEISRNDIGKSLGIKTINLSE